MYGYSFNFNHGVIASSGGGSNPLWDNLLAYYTADNTPNDSVGAANFTLNNGATYGTGIINQGFDFDGVNDYANHTTDVGVTDDFTISTWVYRDTTATSSVFETANFGSAGSFSLTLQGGSIVVYAHNGSSYISQFAGVGITLSTWTHIAFTFNNTTKLVDIYIDGVLSNGSTPTFTSVTSSDFANGMIIGRRLGFQYFNGLTDELGVWNRILTSGEVTELYNSGSGKQYPN